MKNSSAQYFFLFGGSDLEMEEIKNLLMENKQEFADHHLSWDNATWKAYTDELNDSKNRGKTFIGIELATKENKPKDAVDIDHHNFDSEKKSSIEQVAELLKIKLNRWQELVAANDRGYIPEMERMCASKEEIKKIREADKKAQGVTEGDENKAYKSIKNNKEITSGFVIIKSATDKFSTITDLMYGKAEKLIVFTDTSLNYYGPITDKLISCYKNQIETNRAYYGGSSNNGFFGLAKGHWNKNEIEKEKQKIIEIMNEVPDEKIFSHHIFLFPFRWKNWRPGKGTRLEEDFDIETFEANLSTGSNWKRTPFKLSSFDHYNEYNYFYEYVREILYDLDDSLKTERTLLNHFEYQIPKGERLFYNIKLTGNKIFHLEIDSILLNIYKTGTGILSFHLRNHNYQDQNDILKINKFGRRLFVPFFDLKPDSIYTGDKDDTNEELLLCSTKNYEIPDAIWIGQPEIPDIKNSLFEDFNKYLDKETFKHGPFVIPRFIEGLFPKNFFIIHKKEDGKRGSSGNQNSEFKVYLRPVLDDRMFVVSWYGNNKLAKNLRQISNCPDFKIEETGIKDNRNKKSFYSYETDNWWYSYIYVDTFPMHTNKFQRQELLRNQTYSRWVEEGTLYGTSRYSLVMLTSDFSNTPPYLVRHLQSMYYKMAELCLLQRATILSFSNEVTVVGDLINSDTKDKRVLAKIESLYKHYLLFVNKIYFREITAQEQGIEMYDLMQNSLRIPQEVKSLDYEIDELNRLSDMLHNVDEQEEMKKLTKIATAFLTPTLLVALLTMKPMPEFLDFPNLKWVTHSVWAFYLTVVIAVVVLSVIIYQIIIRLILKLSKQNTKTNKKYRNHE